MGACQSAGSPTSGDTAGKRAKLCCGDLPPCAVPAPDIGFKLEQHEEDFLKTHCGHWFHDRDHQHYTLERWPNGKLTKEGALGYVFAARRKSDNLEVAIKIKKNKLKQGIEHCAEEASLSQTNGSKTDESDFGEADADFRSEVYFTAPAIKAHQDCRTEGFQYIIRILEVNVETQVEYIVMEKVQPLPEAGHVTERFFYDFLMGIAKGLQALHKENIAHGDLHPGNVLLGNDGNPKLCDFGKSKASMTKDDMEGLGYIINRCISTDTPESGESVYDDNRARGWLEGSEYRHLFEKLSSLCDEEGYFLTMQDVIDHLNGEAFQKMLLRTASDI